MTYLNALLADIRGAGIIHYINAANAETDGNATRALDMANRNVELISTYTPAPVLNTAIAGRPTLTFGTGTAGTTSQILRPKRYSDLNLGTGSWSIGMLVRATGTTNADVIVSPERVAKMEAGNYSPYIRFAAAGDKTQAPSLIGNDGDPRSVCNTKEFNNTNRLLLLCGTPGVGLTWYVDDWSTPALTHTTAAAKEVFTDGRFVLGGPGWTPSSLTFAGSLAVFTAHNVDLSLNHPARRDLMKAIAGYGGITSN
ncbi:hypothetical protein LP421_16985 [Rhizobium sp. RCAM05350]|nr:hypothetical protein LP421_16985 [Rhizobium sp. RCAM05350]